MENGDDHEAQAIQAARARWSESESTVDQWSTWFALRDLLHTRWERSRRPEDLDEIIQKDLALLMAKPDASRLSLPDYAFRLACLALAYSDRCKRTHATTDNAKSIFFGRLALALLPPGRQNLEAVVRSQLSLSILHRATERNDMRLMNEAVDLAFSAPAMTTNRTGISYKEQLDAIGNAFRQRFLLSGDPTDLEQSIHALEQEASLNNGDASGIHQNLSYSLSLRFDLMGIPHDLDRAIASGFKALEGSHISLESVVDRSRNLVNFLEARFDAYGEARDIRRAKVLLRPLVDHLEPENSRYAALCLSLGKLLRLSSEASNNLEELSTAIDIARKGVAVTNARLSTKAAVRNELGLLLAARHRRTGREEDALDALDHYQAALEIRPTTERARAMVVGNIACTYDDRYRVTRDIKHLERSYELSLDAIKISKLRAYIPAFLSAANQCVRLFEAKKPEEKYLSQGLNVIHQGLAFVNKAKPREWAQLCLTAGILYDLKHTRTGDAEDFTSALVMCIETWYIKTAPLQTRLRAIRLACDLLMQKERWLEAWNFLQDAVQLVPLYCASSSDQRDQQFMISDLSGIATRACTAGLMVGETAKALEIWEQGRGIVVASSYNAVTELSRLKIEHPSLYSAFIKRRMAAFEIHGAALPPNENSLDGAYLARDQMRADSREQLLAIVEEIRRCDMFKDFLLPMTVEKMQSLTGQGAIVVLNHSQEHTHAIILTKSHIQSLELRTPPETPKLFSRLYNIMEVVMADLSLPKRERPLDMTEPHKKMRALLYKLWHSVAQPVCAALGFTQERFTSKINESPPNISACRIRWLTSGGFSRLPLHAAGIWTGSCQDVLPKCAVSSYAASFRILEYTSVKSKHMGGTDLRGLFVSMERPSVGVPYRRKEWFLNTANQERSFVQMANPDIKWTALVRPSSKRVLQELPKYEVAHFATHGVSDPEDSLNSHLLLLNLSLQDSPPCVLATRDNLSVTDIFRSTSENAVLAFLAACYTADSPNPKLEDESLHIANAFQIAGFPHVIGSLWPASGHACPGFAKTFYESLAQWCGEISLSNDLVALAAQYAVMVLIRDYIHEPRLWAGFVHFGP